ncbi:MAG: M28 family peptidase, partial [Bacteriovoracaceae bacterium]|nr:M28 family peptidase [Bacteriovoracaceae bacterium]
GHSKVAPWLVSKIKELDPSGDNLLTVEEFYPDIAHAMGVYKKEFEDNISSKFSKTHPEYKKWSGFTKSIQRTLTQFKGLKGKNVVWEKKGFLSPNEVIVIGAHYDTIVYDPKTFQVDTKSDMPGADDNGTGVAALLSLIDILSELNIPKTVRIVFFDFQELGFLGSKAYVDKHLKELRSTTKGYINVEMIGNDTKLYDKTKKLRNFKAYIRSKGDIGYFKDKKLADIIIKGGIRSNSSMKWTISPNSYDNSDHSNFWRKGIPSVAFTQNLEDDYNSKRHHTANDFPETINANSYYQAFKSIAGGIIAWNFDLIH